jgi:hypothetical protein
VTADAVDAGRDKPTPWDKTESGEPGPGVPGNDSHNMKYDVTKWGEGDQIVDLTEAERNKFVNGVNEKYGAPPSDIAQQLADKSNAQIGRELGVPDKVVRLWRNLVPNGFL